MPFVWIIWMYRSGCDGVTWQGWVRWKVVPHRVSFGKTVEIWYIIVFGFFQFNTYDFVTLLRIFLYFCFSFSFLPFFWIFLDLAAGYDRLTWQGWVRWKSAWHHVVLENAWFKFALPLLCYLELSYLTCATLLYIYTTTYIFSVGVFFVFLILIFFWTY